MTHAVTNGADIISNSWGYSSTDTTINPQLNDVINYALQNGRNGNGTIIIFSSGNGGGPVLYPANLNGVIAVGAVDQFETIFGYSSRGPELNLVAPSGQVGTDQTILCGSVNTRDEVTLNGTVWTLDRDGESGWNTGDHKIAAPDCFNEYKWSPHSGQPTPSNGYTAHYGGTSAAAPQVSGTAALMLSLNSSQTLSQLRSTLENAADKVPGMNGQNFTNEYGYGRLNAYRAVKEAMANQYAGQSFGSSLTLPAFSRLSGTTTVSSGVTLTVAAGETALIEGTVNGSGTAQITVKGKLIIEEMARLNHIKLVSEAGSELIIRDKVELDAGSSQIVLNGQTTIGDDFFLTDAILTVGSTGSLEFEGGATMEFIEIPVMPPLFQSPVFTIQGPVTTAHTPLDPVELRLSPNSTFSDWNGVNITGSSAAGTHLRFVEIHDANTGVSLASTNNVTLENIEIDAPVQAGISSSSSNYLGDNIFVTNSSDIAIDVAGGNPDFDDFDLTGTSSTGLFYVHSLSSVYSQEGLMSGSGTGVRADNASYDKFNGSIDISGSGNDIVAVNDAFVHSSGTIFGGTPKTFSDGTSAIIIENPNNPQKRFYDAGELALLLRDWSRMYRQNRAEAVNWLSSHRPMLSGKLKPAAALLLADHYLAHGLFAEVQQLLDGIDRRLAEEAFGSHAVALRELQLHVFGLPDKTRAQQSLHTVLQADELPEYFRQRMKQHFEAVYERFEEPVATKQALSEEPVLANYPNPFNPATTIRYTLDRQAEIRLRVYDLLGREVAELASGVQPAGRYSVPFNASGLSSGLYIYRLEINGSNQVRTLTGKMTLLK